MDRLTRRVSADIEVGLVELSRLAERIELVKSDWEVISDFFMALMLIDLDIHALVEERVIIMVTNAENLMVAERDANNEWHQTQSRLF